MAKRPNLLFIFTDRQRYDTMRCYGNNHIQTPNLNALAEESFVFRHAYVTQPVCTPSRSTIMTGLYPHTTGCTLNNVPLRPETRTLAEMVSDEYLCGYYGKWHLGDEVVPQHGFERRLSTEDNYRPHYSKAEYLSRFTDYHRFLIESEFTPDTEKQGAKVFSREMAARLPERFTKAAFTGREAARFIRENRERPFVLYVSFLEPHMPYTGPFDDLYPPDEIPTGPHFLQKPPQDAPLPNRMLAEHYMAQVNYDGPDLRTEAGWRKLRAQYWGLVTLVDRAVGEILRALEESGLSENTIVVFTSDHGDMMGDHGLLGMCVLYEEAVRVPLLVRAPWLGKEQRVVEGRISLVDLVPTLLDLMGEPVPGGLQGESRGGCFGGKGRWRGTTCSSSGWATAVGSFPGFRRILPIRMLADHYMAQADYEGHDLRTEAGWRKLRAQYWGLVTLVDRAVGEILRALEESGLSGNTIVVYTSDHGDMMGDHGLVAKCVLYEEAVKVPLLMRVPWLGRKQRALEGRVSQVDLVPTLLELMGQGVPEGLEGESRAGVLRGETTLEGNDVFVEWIGHDGRDAGNRPGFPPDPFEERVNRLLGMPWRTVVSAEGWKLNLSPEDRCELYDLNADPYEQANLFDDPTQRVRIRDLADRIGRWQEHTRDDVPLPPV